MASENMASADPPIDASTSGAGYPKVGQILLPRTFRDIFKHSTSFIQFHKIIIVTFFSSTMLVTENSHQLIDTTTKKIIELYNRVLGTQSNKQKLPYIAGAVAAVVLYKAYSVIALPPKALRGLPYINNFKVIWSTLRGDTPWIQYKKLYAPALARSNNLGMYVVSEIFPN